MTHQPLETPRQRTNSRNILEYGRAEPRFGRLIRFLKMHRIRIAIVTALVLAAFVPHPGVQWYFGHRPQWMVYIDDNAAYFGKTDDPIRLDPWPFLMLKLAIVSLPVWIVIRLISWGKKRHQASRAPAP